MSTPLRPSVRLVVAFSAAIYLASMTCAHAVIDTSVTQRIWKTKYGVSDSQMFAQGGASGAINTEWMKDDTDGDGITNEEEMAAGTNPFNPAKTLAVKSIARTGSDAELQFPTESGKLYRVEATTTLTNPGSWTLRPQPTPVQVIGDGEVKTLKVPYVQNSFYRIRVDEFDTDNDGVSDWAETVVGLNPLSPETIVGVPDHGYVVDQLELPSTVTIKASKAFASEDGPEAGVLTVTRTQNLFAISVSYTVGGTALPNIDYTPLSGTVSLPSGANSADIFVNPLVQAAVKGGRSVTATLTAPANPDAAFTLGAATTATVIINDSIIPTGTGLLGRYYDHANGTYAHAANFGDAGTYTYVRTGTGTPNTGTITIPYTKTPAVQVGHVVRCTFTGGNLNTATYNNLDYTVTAVSPGVSFTLGITGAALPTNSTSTCNFSIQSFTHPAALERVDPTVDFDWGAGLPNGGTIVGSDVPDNYSSAWDGYLHPTTAGNYQFQLDADDKARVLLDLNDGNGLQQIVEHGWDAPATIGTFKQSAAIPLVIPGSPSQRYRIRVEHVESTGNARCRVQWRLGTNAYANIPQGNVFTHTRALTNYTVSSQVATINTAVAHGLSVGNTVDLSFSSGTLFTPPANYSGTYNVATVVDADTFTISVPGAANQTAAAGYMADPTSLTTGWMVRLRKVTDFSTPFAEVPGRVAVDPAGATSLNNGILLLGTPDVNLIHHNLFSVRWSGQVQPQFSEDYTFAVHADDGCSLWINGQLQELQTAVGTNQGGSSYVYNAATGDALVLFPGLVVKPGSFVVGETVRLDPTSGNLSHGLNSTYSYDGATGNAVIDFSNLTNILPNGFVVGETIELDPTSGSLSPLGGVPYVITAVTSTTFTVNFGTGIFATGTGTINILDSRNGVITAVYLSGAGTYSYNQTTGAAVVNYSALPGVTPGSLAVGDTVQLDPSSGNLSSLSWGSHVISAVTPTTFTVDFGAGTFATGTGNISIAAPASATIPAGITTAFSVNFGAGKYANNSSGNMNVEIVNKPLKDWSSMGNERYVRVPMLAGVRYDIQLDYWESGGHARCRLFWFSSSQPRQIIPAERLYPSNGELAPAAVTSPTEASALAGGPFSHQVAGSNGASVSISGNPAWLTYNNGEISGTPPAGAGGDYQILITLTTATGTATSVLNLHVEEAGGSVVRELWTGISGNSVASIPVQTAPASTSNLSSLNVPVAAQDANDYGARIRGFLTAPTTGNYYFWIAGSNGAELWISNDEEPVNAVKRAWITNGTAAQAWTGNPGEPNQKSPWLALEGGRKYYFEVLHKAGTGTGDSIAVGWQKPGQTGSVPSEVVPGYALSPWAELVPPNPGSTVYSAILRPQGAVVTSASGSSFMRLNAAETEAVVTVKYNDLSSAYFGMHIHNDMIQGGHPANIIADLDEPGDVQELPDGTWRWVIRETSGRSVAQLVSDLKAGKVYFNVHSTNFPNGEIKGYYNRVDGSQTFTPPPAPPALTDDHNTDAGAVRFLTQASFGPNIADIVSLKTVGYDAWINSQFTKAPSLQLPEVLRTETASAQGGAFEEYLTFNAWWRNSVAGEDQLRQRVAFALSEILVVSAAGPLDNRAEALAYYYDRLAANAFGNFRDILEIVTLTPTMGRYLDMLRNDKPDLSVGRIPNENYAREIKQLFSIGLFRMWPDGTLVLNSKFEPIETYTQREIVGFAHTFTGWDYGYDGAYRASIGAGANWMRQMREVPARHFTGPKRILNNEVLPGLPTLGGQRLDPHAVHPSNLYNDPAYQALPTQELDATHDQLFNHPNVGPFICRQLIQRLVTSHPSRGYLYRVVQKFNDNGSGIRGDMKAVIKAILLDYEARDPGMIADPTFGKQREPVLRIAAAGRAFRPSGFTGTYAQTGTQTIAVTTATPHLLSNGDSVFLDFNTDNPGAPGNSTSDPAPFIGNYTVSGTPASPTTFNVLAQGWATSVTTTNPPGYRIPANSTTCTVTMNNHWLQNGHKVFVDFTSGPANGVAGLDGMVYTLTSASAETGNNGTFTFEVASAQTTERTGNCMIPRFSPGSFTTAASGLPAPEDRRVTMDTNTDHHLQPGDQVQLNFYGGNPQPVDMVATVDTVVDLNTWTFLAPSAGTNLGTNQGFNSVYQFPLVSQPLTRAGVVGSRPSSFDMRNTDPVIDQTPLNSPTVFNFFLPDYKFPGTLATLGLTTPEFQTTAETSIIRQSNYIFNGIFNQSNTAGLSGFYGNGLSANSLAVAMDYSRWIVTPTTGSPLVNLGLGAPTDPLKPWTNNENLTALIDHLSMLLTAGQLSSQAKAIIRELVARPIASISTGNPCTVTTVGPHGLVSGSSVVISGVNGGTFSSSLNSTSIARVVTVTGPTDGSSTTFTIPVSCTAAPNAAALSTAHVSMIGYNNGVATPSPATALEKRNRLRAILHLIVTSPDYTIQR